MQPAHDEQTATPSEVTHLLDYTNLANLGDAALTARLQLIGKQHHVVSELGGRIAAVLLARPGTTPDKLADAAGIPQQTLSRWTAPYRTAVAS